MKKRVSTVICIFLIILMFCVAAFFVVNTDWFRVQRLENQLRDKYGLSFDISANKDEEYQSQPVSDHVYRALSEEGVTCLVSSDWTGKLRSDSYAHYYYASDMDRIIEDSISESLDEFYVVRDCRSHRANMTYTEFVDTDTSSSFEKYLNSDHEVTPSFYVYVKQDTKTTDLVNAVNSLRNKESGYNVYFLKVTDDVYSMISGSGLKCFYVFSGADDDLRAHAGSVSEKEIEDLLSNPFEYRVAEYAPEYGHVGTMISREYFENLDPNTGLDKIMEEIGFPGMKGSGIVYFVWSLSDGSYANVLFNNSGTIETIYIESHDQSELIYERDCT